MLNEMVPTSPSAVKPDAERPIRYTRDGRVWWISVTRSCGHTDFIPDDDSVHGAQDFAARTDVKCGRCRQADHEAAPYIPAPRATKSSHGSRTGAGSDSRPSRATNRKHRPSDDDKTQDAIWWYTNADDFLKAVDAGQVKASAHSIAFAKNKRAEALRTLKKLGAVA